MKTVYLSKFHDKRIVGLSIWTADDTPYESRVIPRDCVAYYIALVCPKGFISNDSQNPLRPKDFYKLNMAINRAHFNPPEDDTLMELEEKIHAMLNLYEQHRKH